MCDETPAAALLLPTSSGSPAAAREWTRLTLCTQHHEGVLDDALLLISELVTNAVVHGGPPIVVSSDCSRGVLRMHVRDGSAALPVLRHATPDATGGRGLALLDAIASAWGVSSSHDASGPGKDVWFELAPATPLS